MNAPMKHTGMSVEDALTCNNPVTACLARLASSSAAEEIFKFVNAEFDRDTATTSLLTALAVFYIQTHSSVAAQLVGPNGCKASMSLFSELLNQEYVEHAQRTHNLIKEAAAL